MKKSYLLTVLSLFSILFVNAQEYGFGVQGGLNTYKIGSVNSRGGSIQAGKPNELFQPKKAMGFQVGAYFIVQFDKLFIKPEVNYVSSKNTYDFPTKTSNWKTSKIDIPLLVGYEVFEPVSIYAGPGFNIYGDTTLDGVQVTSYSDGGPDLEKTTFNFNVGIMVKIKRIAIDLRYEGAIKETQEELVDIVYSSYGVNLADLRAYKPNTLRLSVSFDLFRTDGDQIGNIFSDLFKGDKCHCPYNK
jgi:hypothetical protein